MYKHILVPVSFDENRKTDEALRLTDPLGGGKAKVTLLHVVEHVPVYAASYLPDDFLEESRKSVLADLREMAKAVPGAAVEVEVGHAGASILDYANENGVDCIVIASHDPGLQDYFLSGTAAHVVRHAHCAVHVVR